MVYEASDLVYQLLNFEFMRAINLTSTTISVILICFMLSACREDNPTSEVMLPSNLTLEVNLDNNVEGKVNAIASADAANFYSFTFKDEYIESDDGTASYTFQESGSFEIIARAHATQDEYVQTSQTVNISFSSPINGSDSGYKTPTSYNGYNLIWNEEFEGTELSESDWNFEIGTGNNGWGNNELQYYLDRNTRIENGRLIIEAKTESVEGRSYTSSRLTTEGKQSFQYGRIDIRAKMPFGQGIWPALWMLGGNFRSAGWPFCGEIDIMEMVGGNVTGGGDHVVHGTVHWDNNGQYANFGDSKIMPEPLANAFHVYTIIWDETEIVWYIDDIRYNTIDITPSALSEFHQPFFFIVNVAVGGNWPGSPNASTRFPQFMEVDYIRVFQAE